MSITGCPGQHTLVRRLPGKHHSFHTLAVRPCCAPVRAGGCRGLWRAVHRLKHPTCPVRNVYHRLPEPAYACQPPAGQSPQFPHACCPPLLCPSARRRVPGPVAGRAQAETPHMSSTECLSQASRASTRLSAARRASTTVSTPQPCAPALCMDLRRKDFSRDQNVVFHSPPRPTDLKSSIFNPQ